MAKHEFKFSVIGGMTRVMIESGEDIKHLDELDQKLWTVLSCPVNGLELDSKTLKMLDTANNGRIHVNEVVAASKWLSNVVADLNLLKQRSDTMPFSAFNTETEDGKRLLNSAKQILKNLGLEKDSISIADTSDSVAIFAKTGLNGDGIVTDLSTEDAELKDVIASAAATVGSKVDRSGLAGVDAELVEKFYAELAAYSAWQAQFAANEADICPFGADTASAFATVESIKEKVADYFMRCKLAGFNADSSAALDVSADRINSISDQDLSACNDVIAKYPLARLTSNNTLPIDGRVNPVWQGAIGTLKKLVFDKEFPGATELTEEQWNSVVAKVSAYGAWLGAKAGASVESLGLEKVNALLKADRKADLLQLIEDDKALTAESTSIDEVDKLIHLYRDFYTLLCNFVSFSDFYNPEKKAVFQAGTLYIDQRSLDLCMKVTDMGPHNSSASSSGMYILYCDCICKTTKEKMTIAAVVTNGEIADLRVGKHAVFYDRQGRDWDATVTKIVDNPISIRQAFFSPYRKLGKTIEDTINKFASEKDSKVTANLDKAVTAPKEDKPAFDIAKYAGIFAAVGLAVSAIGVALANIFKVLAGLNWWQWIVVICGLMLVISGPAMIKAWLNIRKRNLSPLLNANGWAINAAVKVNVTFGATLTNLSKTPLKAVGKDPFEDKKSPWRFVIYLLILAGAAFGGWIIYQNKQAAKAAAEAEANAPKVETVAETPAGVEAAEVSADTAAE